MRAPLRVRRHKDFGKAMEQLLQVEQSPVSLWFRHIRGRDMEYIFCALSPRLLFIWQALFSLMIQISNISTWISIRNWRGILIAMGGSLKSAKCFYHLILFHQRWMSPGSAMTMKSILNSVWWFLWKMVHVQLLNNSQSQSQQRLWVRWHVHLEVAMGQLYKWRKNCKDGSTKQNSSGQTVFARSCLWDQ